MWNYSYSMADGMILIILMAHYFSTPRVNSQVNRTFIQLLNLHLGTLVMDILATRADESFDILPAYWLWILNMAFFVLYIARIYWFFRMTCSILHIDRRRDKRGELLFGSVFALSELFALSSFFTGAVFRITDSGYTRGPAYNVLYVCWAFYLLCGLVLLFRHGKALRRYEFFSVLGVYLILIAGNVARFLLPRYLIMSIFCLMAILIIYLVFEDPERYLTSRHTAFNMTALREEMGDIVSKGRSFHILAFVIQDYVDTRGIYGGAQMDRGVDLIARHLTVNYPGYEVFYLRNGCFAMLGPNNRLWETILQQIVERFQHPWVADDAELYLAVAFASIDSDMGLTSSDKIVNSLVSALNRASQAVDNRIELDDIRELERETEVKRALDHTLEQNKLEVFLQPMFDSRTRQPVAAEALARIRDASGKLISPSVFVPIAERSGKINILGEQVLQKTCRFIKEHALETMGLSWINVNLSPIQCMKRDLSERFLVILAECGISPELIRLEITEQAVVDIPLLESHIETLRLSGFNFSLDDYGSGYSNLGRVRQYPFVNIKLDMEVVWDYFHDQNQLLPSMVKAFKEMGYNVTAEGIESEEMADALAAIGCDYLQGFYFSKPLPIDEFVKKYAHRD
ncbi:MAG: EAL domain-containing protein [Oscillospiraceae bacterium]|nr:EAL domain-containing protein [Oscillospiraceae bacterium]